MRTDRNNPDKVGIIIDHVGNIYRHGFVDDPRDWSLDAKKRNEKNLIKIKECPQCFMTYSAKHEKCPQCGFENHIVKETKDRKTVDVDLREVQRIENLKNCKYDDIKNCSTFDEILEFQKARGYKIQWAIHMADSIGIKVPGKYNYMRRFMR